MKIIAIEGCDGAGKGTQYNLLTQKLAAMEKRCSAASFPQYDSFFGKEIGYMLSGKSNVRADVVDSKSMALWYAMDRWNTIKNFNFDNTDYLILNRYTLSNAIYQSLRAQNPEKMLKWVLRLEHEVLGLPTPDIYILLDVDHLTSQENVSKKGFRKYVGKEADVYEKHTELIQNVRTAYLQYAQNNENAKVINCMENGEMLSPTEIHEKVLNILIQSGMI